MNNSYKITLDTIEQISIDIIKNLSNKTILLHGDMGSGKTTLISYLVKALGSKDIVSSPTFSIVNEYKTTSDTIYHFDLYRVQSVSEALNFGIEDYLYSNAWVFIEWPNKIESLWPDKFTTLELKLVDDITRKLTITN